MKEFDYLKLEELLFRNIDIVDNLEAILENSDSIKKEEIIEMLDHIVAVHKFHWANLFDYFELGVKQRKLF